MTHAYVRTDVFIRVYIRDTSHSCVPSFKKRQFIHSSKKETYRSAKEPCKSYVTHRIPVYHHSKRDKDRKGERKDKEKERKIQRERKRQRGKKVREANLQGSFADLQGSFADL